MVNGTSLFRYSNIDDIVYKQTLFRNHANRNAAQWVIYPDYKVCHCLMADINVSVAVSGEPRKMVILSELSKELPGAWSGPCLPWSTLTWPAVCIVNMRGEKHASTLDYSLLLIIML